MVGRCGLLTEFIDDQVMVLSLVTYLHERSIVAILDGEMWSSLRAPPRYCPDITYQIPPSTHLLRSHSSETTLLNKRVQILLGRVLV